MEVVRFVTALEKRLSILIEEKVLVKARIVCIVGI
jgi:hypothetical protein